MSNFEQWLFDRRVESIVKTIETTYPRHSETDRAAALQYLQRRFAAAFALEAMQRYGPIYLKMVDYDRPCSREEPFSGLDFFLVGLHVYALPTDLTVSAPVYADCCFIPTWNETAGGYSPESIFPTVNINGEEKIFQRTKVTPPYTDVEFFVWIPA